MADPSPRLLFAQILAREGTEQVTSQQPRIVWEGKISPENLRKLTLAASNMWLDELAESAHRFEHDVKDILTTLKDAAQNRALDAVKGLTKMALKQAVKLRESARDQSARAKQR